MSSNFIWAKLRIYTLPKTNMSPVPWKLMVGSDVFPIESSSLFRGSMLVFQGVKKECHLLPVVPCLLPQKILKRPGYVEGWYLSWRPMQEFRLSAIWALAKPWVVQPMAWAGGGGIIILDKKQEFWGEWRGFLEKHTFFHHLPGVEWYKWTNISLKKNGVETKPPTSRSAWQFEDVSQFFHHFFESATFGWFAHFFFCLFQFPQSTWADALGDQTDYGEYNLLGWELPGTPNNHL